jgi:cystathionine beta-lyase/cystathionine gamma-synthase
VVLADETLHPVDRPLGGGGVVRLSIGLASGDDLIRDLDQALAAAR